MRSPPWRGMRAAGLVCLGAGVGLAGADLRGVRGSEYLPVRRRGRGGPRRPAAGGAGAGPLPRHAARLSGSPGPAWSPRRPRTQNVATPLTRSLAGGSGLPRLKVSRLRGPGCVTAQAARAGHVHVRRGITCSQPRRPDRRARPAERLRRSRCSERAVSTPAALAQLEELIDASGIAPRIEARLPIGVRYRQLRVRTLLAGMLLTQADQRPAHFTRVHHALITLPPEEQLRLGVISEWKSDQHQLTYRQTEAPSAWSPALWTSTYQTVPGGDPAGSAMICWKLASPVSTGRPPARSQWTGATWRPSPARRRTAAATAPTPKRPGGTAAATCCAPGELFFGYYLRPGS